MQSDPPSNSIDIYNTIYYSGNKNHDVVNVEYLHNNFLSKIGTQATSLADETIFQGKLNCQDDMEISGHVNVIGNMTSNAVTKSIFLNTNTIHMGSGICILNINKLAATSSIECDGNLKTTNGIGNVFTSANTLNLGSVGATIHCNKLVIVSDITTNTGNLMTSSNVSNIFTNTNTINLGKQTTGIINTNTIQTKNIKVSSGNIESINTTGNILTNSSNITIGSNALGSNCIIQNKTLTINGNINLSAVQTTLNSGIGHISGTILCSQPFIGTSYKQVLLNFNYIKTTSQWFTTYNIPTSFTIIPQKIINYDPNQITVNILTTNYIQIICANNLNNAVGSCLIYGY